MKKLLIFSLMIISAITADAQRKRTRTATSQGNVVLRMGMGVNSIKQDPDLDPVYKQTSVSFTPAVGYMVIDNLEIGADLGISYTNTEDVFSQSPVLSKTVTNATDVHFAIYVQKYFPLNNWFAFYTHGSLGLSTGTYESNDVLGSVTTPYKPGTGTRNGVGGEANFGFAFTPYNAFSLQANIAGLGISSMKNDPDGSNNTTNTTQAGFNVWRNAYNLTMVWYFGRGLWKK